MRLDASYAAILKVMILAALASLGLIVLLVDRARHGRAADAARLGPWRPIVRTAVKTALVLVLVESLVRGPFYERYVYVPYIRPYPVLAERSGGVHVETLVDALARRRPTLRIAFIGDSTMKALSSPEDVRVPAFIQSDLRTRFPGVDLEVVDASVIGLYASDATLLVAKLMPHVDAVVYGLAMRAFPKERQQSWIRSFSAEMDAPAIARIVRAGGFGWLRGTVPGDDLASGLVSTSWATYGYRVELWRAIVDPRTGLLRGLPLPHPQPTPELSIVPHPLTDELEWAPAEYAPPNHNWEALDVLADLCGTFAAGHCLLYTVPVNPVGRDTLTDPALYRTFLERVAVTAKGGRTTWLDLTDTMTAADFLPPNYAVHDRDPIHLTTGGLAKLGAILADPVARLAADVLAARRGAG